MMVCYIIVKLLKTLIFLIFGIASNLKTVYEIACFSNCKPSDALVFLCMKGGINNCEFTGRRSVFSNGIWGDMEASMQQAKLEDFVTETRS
jgi:hypothetical protein